MLVLSLCSGRSRLLKQWHDAMVAPVRFKKTHWIFFEEVHLLGALLCYPEVSGSSPHWCPYLAPTLQLDMWAPFKVGYRPNSGCSAPRLGIEWRYVCSGVLQENFLYFPWGSALLCYPGVGGSNPPVSKHHTLVCGLLLGGVTVLLGGVTDPGEVAILQGQKWNDAMFTLVNLTSLGPKLQSQNCVDVKYENTFSLRA